MKLLTTLLVRACICGREGRETETRLSLSRARASPGQGGMGQAGAALGARAKRSCPLLVIVSHIQQIPNSTILKSNR